MEEGPTLQQYSKQLNVYDPTETHRGRLFVNWQDQLELSYKTGLAPVVIQALHYQEGIGDVPHNVASEFYMVNNRVSDEHIRATAAEGLLSSAISTETSRAQSEEAKNAGDIALEIATRRGAVTFVTSALAQEVADRITADFNLSSDITNESSARVASDGVHTLAIAVVAADISTEFKRADTEEKRLAGLITTETAARASADAVIVSSSSAFNARAISAEAALQTALTAETAARGLAIEFAQTGASADLAVESERALAAELALTGRIDAVLSNIDASALDSFTEVVNALQGSGAGGLAGAINSEETRATAAEASLQTQISALLAAVLALQAQY